MRVPSNLTRGSVGFNMTPMIDVVFLLIVFFLVSSHLARQEVQLDLDLPEAASGSRSTEEEDARRVVVNVLPEAKPQGRIQIGGTVMSTAKFGETIRYENERADREGQKMEVRIRAHRRVPYREVEPIMVACAKAGVWNVTFAVTGKD